MLESWETPNISTVLVLAALVAVAGCIGLADDEGDGSGEPVSATGEPIEASEAMQSLQEEGYVDPHLDTEPTGEVKEFDIWVEDFSFTDSEDSARSIPGPEIRVQQGDLVRVNLHSDGHTIHWHGYDVPWKMDGVPFLTQDLSPRDDGEPGVYTYEFVAKQPGTYFYHCTVDFPNHKDGGMFGAFIVEPKDGPALAYDREETLMLHEWDSDYFVGPTGPVEDGPLERNPEDKADATKSWAGQAADFAGGQVEGETGIDTWAAGPRDYYPASSARYKPDYDTFMINGASYPDTDPVEIREGEVLRVRLINAGQLHHTMHLHGHHFLVTHLDGYELPEPHWEDTLDLAPGERKDVYVMGTNPGIWNFHDHGGGGNVGSFVANDYAFPGGMKTVLTYEGFTPPGELPQPEDPSAGDLAVYAPSYEKARR